MAQVRSQVWNVERDADGVPIIVDGDTVPVLVSETFIEVPDPEPSEIDLLKQEIADLKEQLSQ
jgi:hypothetical protein